MEIRPATEADAAYFRSSEGIAEATVATFRAPPDMDNCTDAGAVLTKNAEGQIIVRVPWKISDDEILALLSGGTIWLSTWGGLPPHMLEVQPPSASHPSVA